MSIGRLSLPPTLFENGWLLGPSLVLPLSLLLVDSDGSNDECDPNAKVFWKCSTNVSIDPDSRSTLHRILVLLFRFG